ncbi:hypothetical protein N9O74_04645 [Methylophilaceae bacterium]|jgi:hypothetical protein|nr:hypothetical protein [Methylophilaceae bacterium]|tara:strand:- start:3005 stop:3517 length:513 start_codon:yes stop_codon:yes gene_type:complete
MKHPKSELYSAMIPTFAAKNTIGFAAELETLALSVENDEDLKMVLSNYENLLSAIDKSAEIIDNQSRTFEGQVLVVKTLLEIAAEEYAIGVVDGNINNKFEYQDALGFTTVAKNILNSFNSLNSTEDIKRNKIIQIIDNLSTLWPSLVPTERISGDASKILTAVDKINSL